jgi:hypothetical protein
MRQFVAFFFASAILISLCGCGGGSGSKIGPITVQFTTKPGTVAGGTNFVFSVTTQNDTQNRGVNFTLALNQPSNGGTTTPCTSACGALSTQSNVATADGPDTFTTTTTVNYAAPLQPPNPNNLILTATAVADASITTTATFTIGAPEIVVRITNKITNIQPGAAPVTLNAQVQFDPQNVGVTWTLAAEGAACSPTCGALSNPQPLSVVYTPPASLPAAPNDTPTITATSVSDTTRADFDDIRIQAPAQPISVTITNPFAQIDAGSAGVTINAIVTNDVAGQGVTWSLAPSAQTGALSAEQPLSVTYTPPNAAPQPPDNTPTITATSVADSTKSASLTFTITPANAAFQGPYTFWVRAMDDQKHAQVMVGSLVADGAGKITGGELDANYGDGRGLRLISPLSGTYSITRNADESRLVTIALEDVVIPGPKPQRTLAFTLESDESLLGFTESDRGCAIVAGIDRQDLTSTDISEFAGNFSLLVTDVTSSQQLQSARIKVAGNGTILSGTATLLSPGASQVTQDITSGILSGFDNNGRAKLTIMFDNGALYHFIGYATHHNRRLEIIGADASPIQGRATRVNRHSQ